MITKDEIQELLRMVSSSILASIKATEPAEVIESVHVNEIVK